MPKIKLISIKKLINQIKALVEGGNINDQLKAKEILCNKLFPRDLKDGTDSTIIFEVLPILMKFIDSEIEEFQQVGVKFLADITFTEPKENTKLLIDSGVIPKLARFLVDPSKPSIQYHTLVALANIAVSFQQTVVPVIPNIISFLKSTNKKEVYLAVLFFANVTHKCDILIADGIKSLINIMESNNNNACKLQALIALTNTGETLESLKIILENDGLGALKKLCDNLFNDKKRKNLRESAENRKMKFRAICFIKNASMYNENSIDMIIDNNFLPIILEQIAKGDTPEIRNEAIIVIENFVENKRSFLSTLIHEHNIIELLYNNLQPENLTLIISALIVLDNIIEKFENKEFCRQKILQCGNPSKLERFCKSGNEEIAKFSRRIFDFINHPVKETTTRASNDNAAVDDNIFESYNGDSLEALRNSQNRRKRPLNVEIEGPNKRNKISKNLQNDASPDVDNQDRNFDISSSNNAIVGEQTERSNFEERHSSVHSNIENINVILRRYPRKCSPPSDLDNDLTSRPSSHNSLVLSEIAESEEEKFLNERKYSPSDDFDDVASTTSYTTSTAVSEATTLTDEKLNIVQKQSPAPPPIILSLPPNTPQNDEIIHHNNPGNKSTVIATYNIPNVFFIKACCIQLGLKEPDFKFDNNQYLKFLLKIKFSEIKSTSKPASCLPSTIDKTGFSCFSMIFCGKDDPQITDKIKQAIKDRFMDKNYGLIDKATYMSVYNSSTLTDEHIKFVVEHFNFRILVYFNEEWKKFGNFGSEETPLFLIEKKVAQDGINYQIVLSLTE